MQTQEQYQSYTTWLKEVKDIVKALFKDIDLCNYICHEAYNAGISAQEMAYSILDEEGYNHED